MGTFSRKQRKMRLLLSSDTYLFIIVPPQAIEATALRQNGRIVGDAIRVVPKYQAHSLALSITAQLHY